MAVKKNLFLNIIGLAAIALMVIIAAGILYVVYFLPNIPVPNLKVELTAERIARGKYLAYHVTVCMDCHSTREWNRYTGPMTPGTDGKGGETFDQKFGFPGAFYSANITPFYLSGFSDGEIYRVITSGVGKGNRPLFPVMPYLHYGNLDNEDIYSIIAFIRTLPSISYLPPASRADFPMSIIMHTIPQKPVLTPIPFKTDSVNFGKYLVTASGCIDCHTPFRKGKLIMDMAFAGGREFDLLSGILDQPTLPRTWKRVSANIPKTLSLTGSKLMILQPIHHPSSITVILTPLCHGQCMAEWRGEILRQSMFMREL